VSNQKYFKVKGSIKSWAATSEINKKIANLRLIKND
jgi:hypothetical protein